MSKAITNNIEALSVVSNKLIDKISSAIGWIITHDTPNRIAVRDYIQEIEKSNLPPLQKAAIISRAKKDIKEYANQCMIVNKAVACLNETAKPEEVENDWIEHFFDKARLVSEEEFQVIWSRLLAQECNKPGSVPKSLMFIIERMNREDAEVFMRLCAITVSAFNEWSPLVLGSDNKALIDQGLDFDSLIQMESLGLIRFSESIIESGYALVKDDDDLEKHKVSYYNNIYRLPENMDSFPVGHVLFTKDGVALFKVASAEEKEGFWDTIVIPWIEKTIKDQQVWLNVNNENPL